MAITKRNYIPNDYETFTNEPIGTPVLNTWTTFSLDDLFAFDVADDVILYQGGTPVPTSAYDLREDATYTAREAGYSGLTLVKAFRITNATYAGVATTASGKNFGSAVDNELSYLLYQNSVSAGISRTTHTGDASLTTSTTLYNQNHIFSGLSADATFTITDGGGDERNKFTVKNADSTYKIIVTDGTDTYWVIPGQSVEFYTDTDLFWASAGWETVFFDDTYTSNSVAMSAGNIGGSVSVGEKYAVTANSDVNIDVSYYGEIHVKFLTDYQYSQVNVASNNSRFRINNTSGGTISSETSTMNIKQIERWHNPS